MAPRSVLARGNGPYSFTPRSQRLAGEVHAREILTRRDLKIRKCLVVLENAVVLAAGCP